MIFLDISHSGLGWVYVTATDLLDAYTESTLLVLLKDDSHVPYFANIIRY